MVDKLSSEFKWSTIWLADVPAVVLAATLNEEATRQIRSLRSMCMLECR